MIHHFSLVPVLGISVVFFWAFDVSWVVRKIPSGNELSGNTTEWQGFNELSSQVGSLVSQLETGHWQGYWLLIGSTRSTPIHCFLYSWEVAAPLFHGSNPKMNNFLSCAVWSVIGKKWFSAGMVRAHFSIANPISKVPQQLNIAIGITECGNSGKFPQVLLG